MGRAASSQPVALRVVQGPPGSPRRPTPRFSRTMSRASVMEIHWAAEHGLKGIPVFPAIPPDADVPKLWSDEYDPHLAGVRGDRPVGQPARRCRCARLPHRQDQELPDDHGGAVLREPRPLARDPLGRFRTVPEPQFRDDRATRTAGCPRRSRRWTASGGPSTMAASVSCAWTATRSNVHRRTSLLRHELHHGCELSARETRPRPSRSSAWAT